jgi:hypothetical protein
MTIRRRQTRKSYKGLERLQGCIQSQELIAIKLSRISCRSFRIHEQLLAEGFNQSQTKCVENSTIYEHQEDDGKKSNFLYVYCKLK